MLGARSAAELAETVAAASTAAEGDATAIEAQRDGSWDVTLRGGDGSETEVRVSADGAASVRATDGVDDDAPAGVLDDATIASVVDAALAEVDGRVTDIEVDDDAARPYDVTVLASDGRWVEIDLDAQFAAVQSGSDD